MKFKIAEIFKDIKNKGINTPKEEQNTVLCEQDEDMDCWISFLCLSYITANLLNEKTCCLSESEKICVDNDYLPHKSLIPSSQVEFIHKDYESLIESLKEDLERQQANFSSEIEGLQIKISGLENNAHYLKQQLIEQLNLNSEYEYIISNLNQKIKEQSEQLDLSQKNVNIVENKIKSLEEQLEIAKIKFDSQSETSEVEIMSQKDKITSEDAQLITCMNLLQEQELLLNQATAEILELKNDLYEQKKLFSETSQQYEEEIEQLRQENIYYKNLSVPIVKKDKAESEETAREEVGDLKNTLQVAILELEGKKASSEIEEDEVQEIRQQLTQKIQEETVLQELIQSQKKEILELRSLLIEDCQDEEIESTLENLKKKLKETLEDSSLFCDETLLTD